MLRCIERFHSYHSDVVTKLPHAVTNHDLIVRLAQYYRNMCIGTNRLAESKEAVWRPPDKIESLFAANESRFSVINAPTAGARTRQKLPRGSEDFQLYSLATPNGQKVGILLEELGIPYDAHHIHIGKGDQFTSGFVEMNPNSKIPAAMHYNPSLSSVGESNDKGQDQGQGEVRLFESASIMLYLVDTLCPESGFWPRRDDISTRTEVMNWLFWQMSGQGPMTGNYGHFMVYAPDDKFETRDYGVARYGMEALRCCSVLENQLAHNTRMMVKGNITSSETAFLVSNKYSVADMACFPWVHQLLIGYNHQYKQQQSSITSISPTTVVTTTASFLSMNNSEKFPLLLKWHDAIYSRPAVQRGLMVCPFSNQYGTKPWLHPDWVSAST